MAGGGRYDHWDALNLQAPAERWQEHAEHYENTNLLACWRSTITGRSFKQILIFMMGMCWHSRRLSLGVDSNRGSLAHMAVNYHLLSWCLALKPCCYTSFSLNALSLPIFLCVCASLSLIHTRTGTHTQIITHTHSNTSGSSKYAYMLYVETKAKQIGTWTLHL